MQASARARSVAARPHCRAEDSDVILEQLQAHSLRRDIEAAPSQRAQQCPPILQATSELPCARPNTRSCRACACTWRWHATHLLGQHPTPARTSTTIRPGGQAASCNLLSISRGAPALLPPATLGQYFIAVSRTTGRIRNKKLPKIGETLSFLSRRTHRGFRFLLTEI